MEKQPDRERLQPKRSKRKYVPPEIVTQEVFETTALACGKLVGQGGPKCGANPRTP